MGKPAGTIATKNAAYFPAPSPEFQTPAAYSLEVWLRRDDERGVWTAEAPQLAGTKVEALTRKAAIDLCCMKIGQIRNNRGKPRPLALRPLPEKPEDVDEVRVIGVS